MRCIICRPDLYNLKFRKKAKNVHNSRIELSINENTKGLKKIMAKLQVMAEICSII